MILLVTPDELVTARNMIFKHLRNSASIILCYENMLMITLISLTLTPQNSCFR